MSTFFKKIKKDVDKLGIMCYDEYGEVEKKRTSQKNIIKRRFFIMKELKQLNRASIEAFKNSFARFWETTARAQIHSQMLGALETRIGNSSGEECKELEAYRSEIRAKYEVEIDEVFSLMREISWSGEEECSVECYEMLKAANDVICVNFARIAATNEELTEFFVGNK